MGDGLDDAFEINDGDDDDFVLELGESNGIDRPFADGDLEFGDFVLQSGGRDGINKGDGALEIGDFVLELGTGDGIDNGEGALEIGDVVLDLGLLGDATDLSNFGLESVRSNEGGSTSIFTVGGVVFVDRLYCAICC